MANKLIARGQVSIVVHRGAYTITQSAGQYIFSANENGVIQHATSIESVVSVMCGDLPFADFTLGEIAKPPGFSSVVVDNARRTITYNVAAGTTDLPADGRLRVPVMIREQVYELSFVWSKSLRGAPGTAGGQLDWVADWDTNKTQIDAQTLITPKIFAGVKHADGTLTGSAIGRFTLGSVAADGAVVSETIDGIYGFRQGLRTFALESDGSVTMGRGEESVRYDAPSGRILFGAAVSLSWTGAIATAKSEAIESAAATAQSKADTALGSAKSYADTKKSEAISTAVTDADRKINTLAGTLGTAVADAMKAGTDARAVADAITTKAQNEGWSGKLTYIDAHGIFTGTLSANTVHAIQINATQITAGTLSVDRLAAGSIRAEKLDAESIKASIINTDYINGLECTFVRGRIGGWNIGENYIRATEGSESRQATIQLMSASVGSGWWYNGSYRPYGLSVLWKKGGNGGHLVFGQVAASPTEVKTGFMGIQMMDYEGREHFCLSADTAKIGGSAVYNHIAGWNFSNARIWKNNVVLGEDGTILNDQLWRFNNDGSGMLASGNIAWDVSGNVTFGPSVSLKWTSAAEGALTSAKIYADAKKIEAINASATDATTKADAAKELAQALAFGKMLYRVPEFFLRGAVHYNGTNSYCGNSTRSIETVAGCPNSTGYALKYVATAWSTPSDLRIGGFFFGTASRANAVFIVRIIAQIPVGRSIENYHNQFGNGASSKWLTSAAGTGTWQEYICQVKCGSTGTFSTVNHFALVGGAAPTSAAPVVWYIAYATVFDVTSCEKYTTTIDGNGIYTGSLVAAQITAGTLSADRIAVGSIRAEKLDAASIKASIINTDYINGLSCAFVRGTIGGWSIGADNLTCGGVTPIQIRTTSTGWGNWYDRTYHPSGITMTWHQSNNAGHMVFGQVAASGNSVKTGFSGLQMMSWVGQEYFCLAANTTRSGSMEVYNRIAGWAFDSATIWKNNVSLCSDGSITNSSRWRLSNDGSASFGSGKILFNTDGSGRVANGNLSWDATGNLTAVGGFFKDMTIQGTVRSAFVLNDPSIWIGGSDSSQKDPRHYDNVVVMQSGGWLENINLPWTLDQSGRRLCFVNYKWGASITSGYMSISAPSGKYFYEDGIQKSSLSFSREVIELLGYGDSATFFGWIVINRRDMMCDSRYGSFQQVLAQGTVTCNSTSSASIRYKTFDGTTISVAKSGTGNFYVYLPWSLGADKYMVMLTGKTSPVQNTMLYATVRNQYASYFQVSTQDDSSVNDGSFTFQIISTADFK